MCAGCGTAEPPQGIAQGEPIVRAALFRLAFVVPVGALTALSASVQPARALAPQAQATPPSPHALPQTAQPQQVVPRDTKAPKPGTGIIRGRVVAADTGDPLRRARLALSAPELGKPRFANTDGQGRYEFTGLPPARYSLTASKTAYVSLQFGQRRAFQAGTPIELGDAQVLGAIDIVLPRGGVITGRIVDDTGEPVAGASVSAMRPRYSEGSRQLVRIGRAVETDDRGEYRLFGLAPGSYYVGTSSTFLGELLPFGSAYYPGTVNPAEAERVAIKVGQVRAGIDLTLQPVRLASVSGTLADAARGGPLTDATIRAYGAGGSYSIAGVVRPDGSFIVANVPPSDYSLVATGRDPDTVSGLYGALPVTVSGGDVGGLFIGATRGGRASGQITFEGAATPPVAPSAVTLFSEPVRFGGLGAGRVGTIGGDWTFELTSQLGARLLRLAGLPQGWLLKSVRLDGRDITDTPIVFAGTEDIGGIRIILSNRTTTVSGRVIDTRGQAVKEYTVVVFAEDPGRWAAPSRFIATGRPDLDGRFQISRLPPASYLIVALDSLEEGEASDPEILESLRAKATRITLAEGESTTVELKVIASGG
jgi:protocatechuate 3,4-dioxygenase beta subunit